MSETEDTITLNDINWTRPGDIKLCVTPDPLRNSVNISFVWHPKNAGEIYIADLSDVKFRKTDFGGWAEPDYKHHFQVSVDHLKIPIHQLLYAAGMDELLKVSKIERDAFNAHIESLKEMNAKLLSMLAGAIEYEN